MSVSRLSVVLISWLMLFGAMSVMADSDSDSAELDCDDVEQPILKIMCLIFNEKYEQAVSGAAGDVEEEEEAEEATTSTTEEPEELEEPETTEPETTESETTATQTTLAETTEIEVTETTEAETTEIETTEMETTQIETTEAAEIETTEIETTEIETTEAEIALTETTEAVVAPLIIDQEPENTEIADIAGTANDGDYDTDNAQSDESASNDDGDDDDDEVVEEEETTETVEEPEGEEEDEVETTVEPEEAADEAETTEVDIDCPCDFDLADIVEECEESDCLLITYTFNEQMITELDCGGFATFLLMANNEGSSCAVNADQEAVDSQEVFQCQIGLELAADALNCTQTTR